VPTLAVKQNKLSSCLSLQSVFVKYNENENYVENGNKKVKQIRMQKLITTKIKTSKLTGHEKWNSKMQSMSVNATTI